MIPFISCVTSHYFSGGFGLGQTQPQSNLQHGVVGKYNRKPNPPYFFSVGVYKHDLSVWYFTCITLYMSMFVCLYSNKFRIYESCHPCFNKICWHNMAKWLRWQNFESMFLLFCSEFVLWIFEHTSSRNHYSGCGDLINNIISTVLKYFLFRSAAN